MTLAAYAPVLDAVRGLGWPARRRVRSAIAGPHLSVIRGTSAEFVEHRPYRQGDDLRRIDWRLVARTDRVYLRVSQERSILPTMLVLDGSGSMGFPVENAGKWDFARRLALGLAAIARHRGDPVGIAIAHPSGARIIRPRTRRTVLEEMMHAVDLVPAGSPDLTPVATEAMRLGARVVLLSDFLGDSETLQAAAGPCVAAGGELHAVHIVDAGELDPDRKRLLLADPETPGLRRPMPAAAHAEYQRRFGAWREQLARAWRGSGADYLMAVPAAQPIRQTLRQITTPEAGAGQRG